MNLVQTVRRIEGALTEVRQLRGLIPICMHCRRVRTTSEQWQGIEKYIEAHSDAAFSHSICDECMDIHYPDPARDPANPSSGVEPPDDERTGKERAA